MGDGSKTIHLEDCASYSSDEEFEQNTLDLRQYESSKSDSSDSDATVSAVGEDGMSVDSSDSDATVSAVGEDGMSVDSYDQDELVEEAGVIESTEGDASQATFQQPTRLERLLHLKHSRDAGDLSSSAASTSLNAAISCRRVMSATCDAIIDGKVRVIQALRKAESAEKPDDLKRYRALASKYDAALMLAAEKVRLINVVAECAENAAMTDAVQMFQKVKVSTAAQTAKMSTELLAERFAAAHCAAVANMAAIVAYKAEYVSLKAMKACWEDLDFGNVETRDYPTRSQDETRCIGRKEKAVAWCGIAVFVFCMCFLAAISHYTKNPEYKVPIVTVGGILISIPVCILICQIFVCCRNTEVKRAIAVFIFSIGLLAEVSSYIENPKHRISIVIVGGILISISVCILFCWIFVYCSNTEVKRVKNRNIITQIDHRMRELHNYFVNNNITPFLTNKMQ